MSSITRHQRRLQNERLPCDVTGCGRKREWVSRFCVRHLRRTVNTGHPLQPTIRAYMFRKEQSDVRDLLAENTGHSGLILAEKFVSDWLSHRGRFAEVTKAHPIRQQLRRSGVTPRDVVIAGAAIWLFSERFPASLEQDERLTFAIANAVLQLMPRERRQKTPGGRIEYRRPGLAARREIGEVLRREIGALFLNIARTVQAGPERQRMQREQLLAPFDGLAKARITTPSSTNDN